MSVYFGGDEIPDSPFEMTSNPDLKDVMDPGAAGGDGEEEEDDPAYLVEEPERNFAKNGTGIQRKSSKGK